MYVRARSVLQEKSSRHQKFMLSFLTVSDDCQYLSHSMLFISHRLVSWRKKCWEIIYSAIWKVLNFQKKWPNHSQFLFLVRFRSRFTKKFKYARTTLCSYARCSSQRQQIVFKTAYITKETYYDSLYSMINEISQATKAK